MGRPKKVSRIWLTSPRGERIGIDASDVFKLQRNPKLEVTNLKLIDGRTIVVMESVYQVLGALDAVTHPQGRDA
jgi:uncharacterized protein YlzI (FlbEa/FlbD family)